MTISERIFERLEYIFMSQKEFSVKTGIKQSTISEWKKNNTNPTSDKIMAICITLDVTPEWLLSGVEPAKGRLDRQEFYVIDKKSEVGELIDVYNNVDSGLRARLIGYALALNSFRLDFKAQKDNKGK